VNAVVDTNVVAYFLLGTEPFREECARFWRALAEASAPSSWQAEIANVLWMAVRSGVVAMPEALRRLELASALGVRSIASSSLWEGALTRSVTSGIAVYDTLFVELAERNSLPLATFDEAVLSAFPRIAKRPRTILRASA